MRSLTFILTGKTAAARQLILGLMLVMVTAAVSAQHKTISGVVKNADGTAVPKATVQVKGTSRGTTTDEKGEFTIQASTGETLVFSAISLGTMEKKIGATNTINVSMTEETKALEEVVVTALGIKREQMALGYATQNINETQMTDARSNNWASALSGKVAGLTLSGTGSGPAGSMRINLRGDRSLIASNNDALIIVDGVPINSQMSGSTVSQAYQAGAGNDVPVHNGIKNNEALYSVLGERKVHIMSGHTHYHRNVIKGNIFEHNHGTVCGAWWTGSICGDGTPCGYGVYKVNGTELSWHYQSTGESADHQMKIFVNDANDQKQLQVNIWNHDPEWKTEYWVDGSHKGSLEQVEAFDPLAYSTLIGPELPKPRGFAEPRKTEHMFKAMVPATTKEIKVIATDRFGKKYTSTHNI